MHLLVTGASGYVGQRLRHLAPADWQITCLGRSPITGKTPWIQCDLSHEKESRHAAKNFSETTFDAIVHLAAFVPKNLQEDTLDNAITGNITTTANLLKYFGSLTPKLIIGSTVEVYDQAHINGQITEESTVCGSSYYSATKLSSELISQSYSKKNSKLLTILRFSVMYGCYDPISRALPNFIKAARNSEPIHIKGASILRDYIHVDDVVESIFCAVQQEASGVINVGTGIGVTILDAAQMIVDSLGSSSQIIVDQDSHGKDIVINIAKARKELGYEPRFFFPDRLDEMIASYER